MVMEKLLFARGPSPVEGTKLKFGGKIYLTPNDSNDIYLILLHQNKNIIMINLN